MRVGILWLLACCLLVAFTVTAFGGGNGKWARLKTGTNNNLKAVHFINEKRGWAVGEKGTMLVTSDGGKKWKTLNAAPSVDLRGVHFVSKGTGWIVGGGMKMVKGDSMTKESERTVCARTTDGGKTWQEQKTENQNFTFWGVDMTDANTGWLICGIGKGHPDGHWMQTTSGGAKWRMPPTGSEYGRPCRALYDIDFTDKKNGWCVGSPVVVKISYGQGGQKAENTSKLYTNKDGCVLHTSDGGNTWEVQHAGNSKKEYLFGVSFVNARTGWVVGERGIIYRTTDGGKTWKQQTSGTNKSLRDVVFVDKKTGCAVGAGGTILITTNGGKKWKKCAGVTKEDLRGISFPNKKACYVVGDKGTILRCKFK